MEVDEMCPTAQSTNVRARAPYSQNKLSMGSWTTRGTTTVCTMVAEETCTSSTLAINVPFEDMNGRHTPQPLRHAGVQGVRPRAAHRVGVQGVQPRA
eukprot:16427877-Heterocapsa_arctica.AAC.1